MSFLSRLFPNHKTPSRAARLSLTSLEGREMPAVDFVGLGNRINDFLEQTQVKVDQVLDSSTVALPIVNKSARDFKGTFDTSIDGVQAALRTAVTALDTNAQAAFIQSKLADALGTAGVLFDRNNSGGPDSGDVSVTNYNPTAGSITVDLGLAKSLSVNQKFDFNLGLKGLPITVSSTGDVVASVGVLYESLKFGLNPGGSFFLDTSASNVIKVSLDAGVTPTTQLKANVGLFQVTATPLNPGTFGLHGGLAVNLGNQSASFFGSANADLALAGSLNADAAANIGGFKYPNVQADFRLNWAFEGTNSGIANNKSLGSNPVVSFDNVRVGFGDYLSNVLAPLTKAVQTYLTYYKPFLEVVKFQIPGLKDVFSAAGLPEASILGIAKSLVNTGLVSDPVVQAVVRYSDFLSSLQDSFGDLVNPRTNTSLNNMMVNIGSFNLGNGGDLRALPDAGSLSSGQALTQLIPFVTQRAGKIVDQLDAIAANVPQAQGYLNNLKTAIRRLDTEISLTYPFTDDPVNGAFALLLGRDADLVKFKFNLPSLLNVQLQSLIQWYGLAKFGNQFGLPVGANIDGDLNVDVYLSGGYDTKGLRQALRNGFAALSDGFYLDSSKPILDANGKIGIFGGPKIGGTFDFAGLKLGAEAGIQGRGDFNFDHLKVRFDDPNADGDNKFRPFYSDAGRNLFAASGNVSGSLSLVAYAEASYIIDTKRAEKELFRQELGRFLDFSTYTTANPFRPADVVATPRVDVIVDFPALRPDLANGTQRADLYAYTVNDQVRVMYGSTVLGDGVLLATIPLAQPGNTRLGRVIIKGGTAGTTFHIPGSEYGGLIYQVIGQGEVGKADLLDLTSYDFSSIKVRVYVDGTDRYGISRITLTGKRGWVSTTAPSVVEYTRLTGVAVSTRFARASEVTVNGSNSVPVEMNLSDGSDAVTVNAIDPNAALAQRIVVHGNGGADALTFKKAVPTTVGGTLPAKDSYVLDRNQLKYQTKFVPANSLVRTPVDVTSDVAFDGIENVTVDQSVTQDADFALLGVDVGQTLTVLGPVNGSQPFSPTGTYTVGNGSHTLDDFRGKLNIQDRTGTGQLVLDDSNPKPLSLVTDSSQLNGFVSTQYTLGANYTSGAPTMFRRQRSNVYSTNVGYRNHTRGFELTVPSVMASVEVRAGGGSNQFQVNAIPTTAVTLTGGPADDTIVLADRGGRDGSQVTVNGGGGQDAVILDDSAVRNVSNAQRSDWHNLNYQLTNRSATESTMSRADRWSTYTSVDGAGNPLGTWVSLDHTWTSSVNLTGVERYTIRGASGSPNTITMTGNTAANATLIGGEWNDAIMVTAPAPTFARGGLSIEGGESSDTISVYASTLDFPRLTVFGQRREGIFLRKLRLFPIPDCHEMGQISTQDRQDTILSERNLAHGSQKNNAASRPHAANRPPTATHSFVCVIGSCPHTRSSRTSPSTAIPGGYPFRSFGWPFAGPGPSAATSPKLRAGVEPCPLRDR